MLLTKTERASIQAIIDAATSGERGKLTPLDVQMVNELQDILLVWKKPAPTSCGCGSELLTPPVCGKYEDQGGLA